jgi:uncharacterized membrane protein
MVGLLGFVVTIGVLVVQQATSTLSPRFMRLWYRDLLQKVVLATFAGTLTFSFSLLRQVEDTSVPTSASPWPGGWSRPASYCCCSMSTASPTHCGRLARGRDCVLHLPHSVGDFVPNGASRTCCWRSGGVSRSATRCCATVTAGPGSSSRCAAGSSTSTSG